MQDVALKAPRERWAIVEWRERVREIRVTAWHDNDDDDFEG